MKEAAPSPAAPEARPSSGGRSGSCSLLRMPLSKTSLKTEVSSCLMQCTRDRDGASRTNHQHLASAACNVLFFSVLFSARISKYFCRVTLIERAVILRSKSTNMSCNAGVEVKENSSVHVGRKSGAGEGGWVGGGGGVEVKEGRATILFPSRNRVFYNPVQEFNRDLR